MAKTKSASQMNFPYSGKTVVVMGLGRSTLALALWLHANGVKVKVSELKPKDNLPEAAELDPAIEAEYGRHSPAFFEGADAVVLHPSVPADTKPLDEVAQKNIPVLQDFEFLLPQIDVPIIAIAGTHGKTVTSHALMAMLAAGGKKVFLCGDHGQPLAQFFQQDKKPDYLILELSAARLDGVKTLRPKITILTSFSGPQPERAPRVEDYSRLLLKLLKNLTAEEMLIYNFREANLRALMPEVQATKRAFRRKDPASLGPDLAARFRGAYLLNSREMIYTDGSARESYLLRTSHFFGLYQKEDLMAATIAARLLHVGPEKIQSVIEEYPGVPHRLELVKKRGGVRFVNDSRSTHPDGMLKSLEAFPLDPIILIAGGKDTQADFSPLVELVKQRVKTMILVGESKEHINRGLGDYAETFLVGTFEEAILLSYQKSRDGDIILLSPGCESYDMFGTYEDRGNFFKKYIEEF